MTEEVLRLPLPFPPALIPLVIGGGCVCYDTFLTVWREKEFTTGILVVLALIGTVFTGEYMEGAEVSFMMLLGEGLETYAMRRAQSAADHALACAGAKSSDAEFFFQQSGDLQRLTDRFARYFLPLILAICLPVFFVTRDIRRVMAIFVIACPCSLVLSGPSAVLSCVENAARNGVFSGKENDSAAYTQALLAKTRTVILENILLFAFLLNLAGITLSALGLLPMVLGAVLHNISTICVLCNSARLVRWKKKEP